jgi:hypothetical protein
MSLTFGSNLFGIPSSHQGASKPSGSAFRVPFAWTVSVGLSNTGRASASGAACQPVIVSGCELKCVGQRLTPPVANRAIAATAMTVAVLHPRILAALPFT